MERKLIFFAAIVIVLAGAYRTAAFYTAQAKASCVITSGNIMMALYEQTDNTPSGSDIIMPGDTTDKSVYVENTGNNAFYTRIKLKPKITSRQNTKLSADKIQLSINEEGWVAGSDGWYYYTAVVEKGANTKPLDASITFLPEAGNEYMGAKIWVQTVAQAVQCANNGINALQAAGWPAESDF